MARPKNVLKRQMDKPVARPLQAVPSVEKAPEAQVEQSYAIRQLEEKMALLEGRMLNQRKTDAARMMEIVAKSIRTALFTTKDPAKVDQIAKLTDDFAIRFSDLI